MKLTIDKNLRACATDGKAVHHFRFSMEAVRALFTFAQSPTRGAPLTLDLQPLKAPPKPVSAAERLKAEAAARGAALEPERALQAWQAVIYGAGSRTPKGKTLPPGTPDHRDVSEAVAAIEASGDQRYAGTANLGRHLLGTFTQPKAKARTSATA